MTGPAEDADPVDVQEVLDRVDSLDVWRRESRAGGGKLVLVEPTLEEFHETFGRITDAQTFEEVDADGVALAAIQGLSGSVHRQRQRLAAQRAVLEEQAEAIDRQRETVSKQRDDLERLRSKLESLQGELHDLRRAAADDD